MSCFGKSCTSNAVEDVEFTLEHIKIRFGVTIPEGLYVVKYSGDTFSVPPGFSEPFIMENPKIDDMGSDGIFFSGTYYRRKMTEDMDSTNGHLTTVKDNMSVNKLYGSQLRFKKFYKVSPDILNHLDNPETWESYKIGSGGRRRRRRSRHNRRSHRKIKTRKRRSRRY
jgi:hypothetical protein